MPLQTPYTVLLAPSVPASAAWGEWCIVSKTQSSGLTARHHDHSQGCMSGLDSSWREGRWRRGSKHSKNAGTMGSESQTYHERKAMGHGTIRERLGKARTCMCAWAAWH